MTKLVRSVASVDLKADGPTELTFDDLYTWVIWQFPRKFGSGLRGAVRPPLSDHGWLPALVKAKEKRVQVYGHIDRDFETPADAADWLSSLLD